MPTPPVRTYAVLPNVSTIGGRGSFVLPVGVRELPIEFAGPQTLFRSPEVVHERVRMLASGNAQPVRTMVPQGQLFSQHKRLEGDGATRGRHMPAGYSIPGSLDAQAGAPAARVMAAATETSSFSFVETLQALADRLGLTAPPAPPLTPQPSLVRLRPSDQRNAPPMNAAQIVAGSGAALNASPRGRAAQDAIDSVRTAQYRREEDYGG